MAIAGSAAPSFIARMVDGELTMTRQTLRQGVISDVDFAIQELLQGRTVILSARADVVYRVQATLMLTAGQSESPDGLGRG